MGHEQTAFWLHDNIVTFSRFCSCSSSTFCSRLFEALFWVSAKLFWSIWDAGKSDFPFAVRLFILHLYLFYVPGGESRVLQFRLLSTSSSSLSDRWDSVNIIPEIIDAPSTDFSLQTTFHACPNFLAAISTQRGWTGRWDKVKPHGLSQTWDFFLRFPLATNISFFSVQTSH